MKNKKSFLKILLAILIIVLIIFCLFKVYNYCIYSKISKTVDELLDKNYSTDDLYFKTILTEYRDGKEITNIEECARKDNVTCIERTTDFGTGEKNICVSTLNSNNEFWNKYSIYSSENNRELNYILYNKENLEEEISLGLIRNLPYHLSSNKIGDEEKTFIDKIKEMIFLPAIYSKEYNGEKCYVVSIFSSAIKTYVSKESLLPIACEYYSAGNELLQKEIYEYTGELEDEDYDNVNPQDFDKVEYIDWSRNYNENIKNEFPEKPISGTNLEAGETLIENVDLLPEEELNFLKLTGNSFGIKTIRLQSLESYNKFRKMYSNLRELTQEDFEQYTVTLIYKEGYKLSYLEQFENLQNWNIDYVFSSEQTKNKELVLLIAPTSERSVADIIESNEHIKIDAQKAYDILNDNLDKIKQELKLDYVEASVGGFEDRIEKLSNETFAKMSFINKPVEGKEPICWKEFYRIFRGESVGDSHIELTAYIDAMTGELIGVIVE